MQYTRQFCSPTVVNSGISNSHTFTRGFEARGSKPAHKAAHVYFIFIFVGDGVIISTRVPGATERQYIRGRGSQQFKERSYVVHVDRADRGAAPPHATTTDRRERGRRCEANAGDPSPLPLWRFSLLNILARLAFPRSVTRV
jgi:hypothetical protein